MKRMQVLYSGHVQGVGFRYTVKSITPGYEITGWVRNLPDGKVQLVAEGEKQELEAFQKAIRESGLGALIRDEQVEWSEAQGKCKGFVITS